MSYNTQKGEWTINELVLIVSQAKEDMKKGKMYAVNFVSHGTTSEQGIKMHHKDNKGKGKSKKPKTGEPHLKPKKPHFKGNCQFCKKVWA